MVGLTAVFAVVFWLALQRSRLRVGFSALPRERRRLIWLMLGAMAVVTGVVAWAFNSGHSTIGIAVLVAFFVLPEFVRTPLRIRRARARAEASRRRRKH